MKISPKIDFLRLSHLKGPSIWTYRESIEVLIDIGELEDFPSNTIEGFYERLTAWLPGLVEHRCGVGERGGFLMRLRDGTWPGHIMEHVAIELQNLAGSKVGFGKARSTSKRGVYKVVVRTRQYEVGHQALHSARDLILAAMQNQPFDVQASVAQLKQLADKYAIGPSTASIVEAANQRGIPSIRLTDGNLVQLGYGQHQRRIWTAETDRTSAIAESISRDKELTKSLLSAVGVPVPEGEVASGPEHAWDIAQDIGLPVVVKPSDANHGRGVSLDLRTEAAVHAAFAVADAEGLEVLVERHVLGSEHRVLVVGNRVVAAARGEEIWITGNGLDSVQALIDQQINTDPRRGEEEHFPLDTVRLPENTVVMLELDRQGLTPASVPAAEQRVLVQRTGAMTDDVTEQVHPDVAAMATLAARVVGLDVAGVDLVVQDISKPLAAQGGAIVEVNAGPGLLMHLQPAKGNAQPVGEAIVEHLFPNESTGRMPVVGVGGDGDTDPVAHLLAAMLQASNFSTGLSSGQGLFLNRRALAAGNLNEWSCGERLLMNRSLEAAVIKHSARGVLEHGLPYDRCAVAVVTCVSEPVGLEDHDILTLEQNRNVWRTLVDVVLPTGVAVLNADCPESLGMAALCDGEVVLYSAHPMTEAQAQSLQADHLAVVAQVEGAIVVKTADGMQRIADCDHANIQSWMASGMKMGEVLAAVGAAYALGLKPSVIQAAVDATFDLPTTR